MFVYPNWQGLESKIYEITKLQIISCRDCHRRTGVSLIERQRIGAASAITGDDDHYE